MKALAMLVALAACGDNLGDVEGPVVQQDILIDRDGAPRPGAVAELRRFDGDRLEVDVVIPNMTPGNVYTLWWIIHNNDEACVSSPNNEGLKRCGREDRTPEQAIATEETFSYSYPAPDGGQLAPSSGVVRFPTRVYTVDDMMGEPSVGLLDVMGAEVQFTVRDHGPELTGELREAQYTSFNGGCENGGTNECRGVGFATFVDATVQP